MAEKKAAHPVARGAEGSQFVGALDRVETS